METTSYSFRPTNLESISAAITDVTCRKLSAGLCTNAGLLGNPHKTASNFKPGSLPTHTTLIVLLLGGDIELNPGPSVYPCGYCQYNVSWNGDGLCCDNCDMWFHPSCIDISSAEYRALGQTSEEWKCYRCHTVNSSCLMYHSYEVDTHNRFSILSCVTDDSVFLNDSSPSRGTAPWHSSPQSLHPSSEREFPSISTLRSMSRSKRGSSHKCDPNNEVPFPNKRQNLRTFVINCNGIRNKTAELANLVSYTDPDILLFTETKLNNKVSTSEFLPANYKGFRKDRTSAGGGVMIAIRDNLVAEEVDMIEVSAEVIWVKIILHNCNPLYVGSFYRQPSQRSTQQLDELEKSLNYISNLTKNNPNSTLFLGGDFNLGDINWDDLTIYTNSPVKGVCEKLLDILHNFHLEQHQREDTRENRLLDLFCSNKPSLVKSCNAIPGLSDHEVIIADCLIKAKICKKVPRTIHQWSRADWDKLKADTTKFKDSYLSQHESRSVDENYNIINDHITNIMETHVPSKLSRSANKNPWLTNSVKRMCRKKQRLFNRARRTHKRSHWERYKAHKRDTLKAVRRARWSYVNDILQLSLDSGDSKPFWKYIKSQRQDSVGVSPLKSGGRLFSDSLDKAEILNTQFKSVFTKEDSSFIPKLLGPNYPTIDPLIINQNGVEKLLSGLNPSKAAGPDQIPCRILKELSVELAPIFAALFRQSLNTGALPSLWSQAFVSPIYKKGPRCMPENYRPVSLTCVSCKLFEHILCRHIRNHLDRHGILTPLNHGFRTKHACETQLLLTLQDLMTYRDQKDQIDIAVLDFSKAFDTVPHDRMLGKLEFYGITGPVLNWTAAFLKNRVQRVVVDGRQLRSATVDSGVPQGTVLGPLLFLLHINDLPSVVDSQVRLFADDCLVYRPIRSEADQVLLQRDLSALELWGDTWGMRFNATKCNIMRISRSRNPLTRMYSLCNHVLSEVDTAKYLGINLSSELSWFPHVSSVVSKANSTLGFLRRNLRKCPSKLKETAYLSLVRSTLEYATTIWDPYYVRDIDSLEQV